MAKCPRCIKEIDKLIACEPTVTRYNFTLDKEGLVEYEYADDPIGYGDMDYRCPECDETLCMSEHKAISILKGESE